MMDLDIGPIEYLLIEFPGNRFTGEIAPAIADLVENGTIRILDLVFVMKDDDGTISTFEYDELDELAVYAEIDGDAGGVLSDEDLALAAEVLPANSSALLILWEDLWAAPLASAIRGAGGVIRGGERIPHDIVVAALGSMEED